MNADAIIEAWENAARRPSARAAIHPLGRQGRDAYEASGAYAARELERHLSRSDVIVDFGAGDGRVTVPLHDAGFTVIAVDASPTMLERLAERRPGIEAHLNAGDGLLEALGRPVDAVFSLAVLIHHSHADGAAIIAELARALLPRGRLILDLPLYDVARDRAHWSDVTVWTRAELDELADAIDLDVLEAPVSPGIFDYANVGAAHGRPVILGGRRPR